MESFWAAPTGRSGSVAALMVIIIIITFIVPANNTQKNIWDCIDSSYDK